MAYKAQDFLKVIPGTRGNKSRIADKIGCDRSTVYNAVKKWPTVADAIREEKERFKDLMETTIEDKCLNGDTTMMIFYAKTQMKDRGYIEKSNLEHSGEIGIRYINDWRNE